MTGAIADHASDDYEVLRDQLFGIVRPGRRADGYSVLIRCGLAAWARPLGILFLLTKSTSAS
jgi:hypothetical protein